MSGSSRLACSMPTGSKARTFAPMSNRPVTSGIDGASRMSSVSGLKVRPSTAMVLPRSSPPSALATLRAMARKVASALGGELRGKTIAVLGLTFKPDTDDMREAPSIPLVTGLLDMGAKVRAFDPVGMEQAKRELPDITYCADAYACAEGADAVVIVTEWVQFRALDLARLKGVMKQPI